MQAQGGGGRAGAGYGGSIKRRPVCRVAAALRAQPARAAWRAVLPAALSRSGSLTAPCTTIYSSTSLSTAIAEAIRRFTLKTSRPQCLASCSPPGATAQMAAAPATLLGRIGRASILTFYRHADPERAAACDGSTPGGSAGESCSLCNQAAIGMLFAFVSWPLRLSPTLRRKLGVTSAATATSPGCRRTSRRSGTSAIPSLPSMSSLQRASLAA